MCSAQTRWTRRMTTRRAVHYWSMSVRVSVFRCINICLAIVFPITVTVCLSVFILVGISFTGISSITRKAHSEWSLNLQRWYWPSSVNAWSEWLRWICEHEAGRSDKIVATEKHSSGNRCESRLSLNESEEVSKTLIQRRHSIMSFNSKPIQHCLCWSASLTGLEINNYLRDRATGAVEFE